MRKILLLLSVVFIYSCYSPKRECKDFHVGTFVFEQEIDGEKHQSTFIRTKDYQIETYNGKTDTASVRWINNCEFILEKINPKNRQEKKAIHMKILTTTNNGYLFEYGIVGDTKKQKGTIKTIQNKN